MNRFSHRLYRFALLAAFGFAAFPAFAGGPFSGSISALWSDPILSGTYVDGASGHVTFRNDSATVACNLAGCPIALAGDPTISFAWGTGTALISRSVVVFTPNQFVDIGSDQKFELGRLTYTNGASTQGTMAFGAKLTLEARSGGVLLADPLVISVAIGTTINSGTPAQNADFLDFGTGTFGTVVPVSFNVLEGQTATAILYGSIVGDPQLTASNIVLDPASTGAGFIGSGVPAVPEPSSVAMLGLGGAALWAWRRRRV
jgi:hypothetical protein